MKNSFIVTAAFVTAAAGCSGASPSAIPNHAALPQLERVGESKIEQDLFVSDGYESVFELSNKTYKVVNEITGFRDPEGIFIDKNGNLYVAVAQSAYVLEYKSGQGSPICTYSAGLSEPISITVDAAGNVYVADYNYGNGNEGWVIKYAQCRNTISRLYYMRSPFGLAVDASGDLFVSFENGNISFENAIEEFKGGSSNGTILGAAGDNQGLIVDKHGNLIVDDTEAIDLIPPPYNKVKPLVKYVYLPTRCSLNAREDLLFSSNYSRMTVTIYKYPSGVLVKTLSASDGIDGAAGVADSPNAVF